MENSFRKVKINIARTNSYGHYMISAAYKGKNIKVITTDSEAFDFFADDSNMKKHRAALRHCYYKIVNTYENTK